MLAMIEEAPGLVERDSDVLWRCEMRDGTDEPPCTNAAEWVGIWACSCIGASCTPHKRHYDNTLFENSTFGLIRIRCSMHAVCEVPIEKAVVWCLL